MDILKKFDKAFQEVEKADLIYKPSVCWANATKEIVKAIKEHGIDNFRNLPINLSYFVPTYGYPVNGIDDNLNKDILSFLKNKKVSKKVFSEYENLANGFSLALADYRVFKSYKILEKSFIPKNFSESTYGKPKEKFNFEGNNFSRSSLNYLLGLCYLEKLIGYKEINNILEIGGGFGTLGEIILKNENNQTKYINIDIPPTLLIAEYYLSQVFKDYKFSLYDEYKYNEEISIKSLNKISMFYPWQLPYLKGEIDLFVNFISFQEMEPYIVRNYLEQVDRLSSKFIMMRNLREGHILSKGSDTFGVKIPIKTDDYIEMLPNYNLIGKNVFPFGFKTYDGFHHDLLIFERKKY
tara:strand:- start:1657 stop:2712 length:1056 start_codon:yes stop_codon:yes gene_type:complete